MIVLKNGLPAFRVADTAARLVAAAPIGDWDSHGDTQAVRDSAIRATVAAGVLRPDGTRTPLGDIAAGSRAVLDVLVLGWLSADGAHALAYDLLFRPGPRLYVRPRGEADGYILGREGMPAVDILVSAGLGTLYADTPVLSSMVWSDTGNRVRALVGEK